jgi:hypothetical protein
MNTTEKTEISNEEKSIDDLSTDLLNVLRKKFPNMRDKTQKRLKNRFSQLISCFYDSINR